MNWYRTASTVKQDVKSGWTHLIANQPYVLLSVTMLLWSGNWVAGRYLAGAVPPVTLTAIRWSLAFGFLLMLSWRHVRHDLPVLLARWRMMAVLGMLSIGFYNICVYVGLSMTTVVNATLLSSTFPITIAATAYIVYRDRLTVPQAVGILIASCGALVVMTRGDLAHLAQFRFNAGDLWVLLSQVIWALYTILLRERPKVHPMSFQVALIAVGLVPLVPGAAAELALGAEVSLTPDAVVAILYVFINLLTDLLYLVIDKRVRY